MSPFGSTGASPPSYTEKIVLGSTSLAGSFAAKSQTDITSEIGLGLDSLWGAEGQDDDYKEQGDAIDLRVRLGWTHEYSCTLVAPASFENLFGTEFIVHGAENPRDTAHVSLGGEARLDSRIAFALRAESELAPTGQAYDGNAASSYRW